MVGFSSLLYIPIIVFLPPKQKPSVELLVLSSSSVVKTVVDRSEARRF